MTSSASDQVVSTFKVLSPEEKKEVYAILASEYLKLLIMTPSLVQSPTELSSAPVLGCGWAKNLVTISPDFDEPLEDFKEFLE